MKRIRLTKDIYPQHKIGDYTYGTPKILGNGELSIGKFCSIADGCLILLGVDHNPDWITTYPFPAVWPEAAHIPGHPRSKGPVHIGHDVWIGQNTTILSGVRIGNGAIIGAASVVAKDVGPYEIHCGNPARFVRNRFYLPSLCRKVEALQWWNWPLERIKHELPNLLTQARESKLIKGA